MSKKILLLLSFIVTSLGFTQNIQVNQKDSHEAFVEILNNSKELKYNDILKAYDAYLLLHPDAIQVQIYRCKFIGSAYYDEYDDYDLNYEKTNACIDSLFSTYSVHPDVLIYKLENTYGEDKEALINQTISKYESDKANWENVQIGRLYEISARYFDEDYTKSIKFAKKAQNYNDSLDLSVLITNAYISLENTADAKSNLLEKLEYDHEAWTLTQKGELLVELDEFEKALDMFDRVKEKDSTYSNNESLYQIFLDKKNYDLARTYIIQDTINDWNKTAGLQKLADHDFKYSSSDLAFSSYRRIQQESYYDDFFGIKRIKLLFKSPLEPWTPTDLSHILILMTLVLTLLLIPYLWILPIYSASNYFKLPNVKNAVKLPVNWTLRHFWMISFIYLIAQVLLVIIFYYQNYMNFYFDIVYSSFDDELVASDLVTANSIIAFSAFLFVTILFFLNKWRLKYTLSSSLRFVQIIGFSILFVVFNSIIIKILGGFVDLSEAVIYLESLSAKEEIHALMAEYGFLVSVLVVALIVPFYEEIIFRGIILSSTEKHLGYKSANIIQASLFAIVHFSLHLFIFYFIFGLITGYAAKKTNGLFTGIVFHAVNNFIVLVSLYAVSRFLPGLL